MFINIIDYIKNGLPKWTLGEILLFFGSIGVFAKWVEDVFGKKYIGNNIYGKVKKIITTPSKILTTQDEIQKTLAEIQIELQYNGGGETLKQVVRELRKDSIETKEQALINGQKLYEIDAYLQMSDDIDDLMKFKVNAKGACYWCNRAFYKFFGLNKNNVLDFNWENTLLEEEINHVRFKWERSIATQSEFLDTHSILDINGKPWKCEVRGIPVKIKNELRGFYGTIKVLNSNLS